MSSIIGISSDLIVGAIFVVDIGLFANSVMMETLYMQRGGHLVVIKYWQ